MTELEAILARLEEEFESWEDLLAQLSEQQITSSRLPNGWSIKDLMAHLMSWQQVTLARLEAARRNEEPAFPEWLTGESPENEEHIHRFNARIFEKHRARSWSSVHREWRERFGKVLELGRKIPERDLMEPGRYPWLEGRPLVAVLHGTYEHHRVDHRGSLLAWIDDRRLRDPRQGPSGK